MLFGLWRSEKRVQELLTGYLRQVTSSLDSLKAVFPSCLDGTQARGSELTNPVHKLESAADGKKTIIYHQGSTRNFSSFAASLDDEQQTITVGVNVSSVIAAAKGIKRRSEELAKAAK